MVDCEGELVDVSYPCFFKRISYRELNSDIGFGPGDTLIEELLVDPKLGYYIQDANVLGFLSSSQ